MQQNSVAFKRGAEPTRTEANCLLTVNISKRLKEIGGGYYPIKEVELVDLKRQESIQQRLPTKPSGESPGGACNPVREAAGNSEPCCNSNARQISEEVGRLWVEITERERSLMGWSSIVTGSAGLFS
jgi:hypothetical protein